MKRAAILAVSLLALPALADQARILRAHLTGYHEVPSVSTQATGEFFGRTATDRSSIEYTLTFGGLQAPVTQSHIHFAQAGVNGSIVIWLCGTATNPGPAGTQTCPQEGTITGTITAADVLASAGPQQLAAGDIDAIIDAMIAGSAYANVHTAVSLGGEIRGQLLRAEN